MKLFHLGGGACGGVQHGYVHDAYSPLPAQGIEGRPGSGELVTWHETQPVCERTVVHAMAIDGYGAVAGWHLKEDAGAPVLESPDRSQRWRLDVNAAATRMHLEERQEGRTWAVQCSGGPWKVTHE